MPIQLHKSMPIYQTYRAWSQMHLESYFHILRKWTGSRDRCGGFSLPCCWYRCCWLRFSVWVGYAGSFVASAYLEGIHKLKYKKCRYISSQHLPLSLCRIHSQDSSLLVKYHCHQCHTINPDTSNKHVNNSHNTTQHKRKRRTESIIIKTLSSVSRMTQRTNRKREYPKPKQRFVNKKL